MLARKQKIELDIFVIQSSLRTISVAVYNKQSIDGPRVTEFCQQFRKLLDHIFDDMQKKFPWMQNLTFEYGIICPVCSSSPNKCKSHGMEGCTRDSSLHFVNEEKLIVGRPECRENVANLNNLIDEEAYIYWFPRQVASNKSLLANAKEMIKEKLDLKSDNKIDEYFRKFALGQPQHRVSVSVLEDTIRLIKSSIGAIVAVNISDVPKCGATCFRIGSKYVITNKHVIDEIHQLGINWNRCYVDFNYNEEGEPAKRVDFAPNPVLVDSEELDYAILKLSSAGGQIPSSVTELGFNIAPPGRQLKGGECLTFIGHPGGMKKHIDVSCPIKLQQDTQQLHNLQLFCMIQEVTDYAAYDVSTFFKGSSGSPGVLMEEKLLVVLHSGGKIVEGTHHALEYGTLMSSVVKDVIKQINDVTIQKTTLDDIFGGLTSSTFIMDFV